MTSVNEFDYHLPSNLIAAHPAKMRSQSRLLHVDRASGQIVHKAFTDIIDLIQPNDLLVVNDSKVIAARLFGHKASGGKIEVLIERITGNQEALAHVRSNKPIKPGLTIHFEHSDATAVVTSKQHSLCHLVFSGTDTVLALTEAIGHMPLPPYMNRDDECIDKERYQTVYAKHDGSVAAPTAGLHFDTETLERIKQKGTSIATVTLHVGAGTFQPVRETTIEKHKMHAERIEVSQAVCDAIHACKKRQGRVIAVGTTSVRSLETAASQGDIHPYSGDTSIFIYPGYHFNCIDAMITNFHLPKSTLIMLVSAFAGKALVLEAYQKAIQEKYRFFSYGDAMFIE